MVGAPLTFIVFSAHPIVDEKATESAGPRRFLVDVEETIRIVLEQEDTDGDFQVRSVA